MICSMHSEDSKDCFDLLKKRWKISLVHLVLFLVWFLGCHSSFLLLVQLLLLLPHPVSFITLHFGNYSTHFISHLPMYFAFVSIFFWNFIIQSFILYWYSYHGNRFHPGGNCVTLLLILIVWSKSMMRSFNIELLMCNLNRVRSWIND